MIKQNSPVIAIDGPSGSGKGTISQLLAKKLGWHFLDSGALYRVLAFAAEERGVDVGDTSGLKVLAKGLIISFEIRASGISPRVILGGRDITEEIRTERCGMVASKIAIYPEVRAALLERQRLFRQPPGLVADGRDMGTVVFPEAKLKIYLSATSEERAKRRYKQLKANGICVTLAHVLAEVIERDKRDRERTVAPLKPDADALTIDTTLLSIDDVLEQVIQHVERKF